LLKFLGIIIFTFLLTAFLPSFSEGSAISQLSPLPIATIFAIVVAFYINDALSRIKGIDHSIAAELSRTRRVFHISKGFVGNKTVELWAKELREKDLAYMQSFSVHDLSEYDDTNKEFRELTYHIYQIDPKILKTPKEIELYRDLLETTREWALLRQNIQELKRQSISVYSWVILLSISAILIFSVLLLRSEEVFATKLVSGLTVIGVIFLLDLLGEINFISKYEKASIARRYLFNLDKLKMDLPEIESGELTKVEEKKQEKEEGIKKQKVK